MSDTPVIHIVDDEEDVRRSLAFLLSASGYAARTHASAAAFLKIAPGLTNACLITDLRMPDMSGIELLHALNEKGAMLPTIVITGHGDIQMAVDAMKTGALDFIEKPFSEDALLKAVESACRTVTEKADRDRERAAVRSRLAVLSERERQVLRGVVAGHSNKRIAQQLDLSPRTVEVYRASLMGKMQATSLADLVRLTMGLDVEA